MCKSCLLSPWLASFFIWQWVYSTGIRFQCWIWQQSESRPNLIWHYHASIVLLSRPVLITLTLFIKIKWMEHMWHAWIHVVEVLRKQKTQLHPSNIIRILIVYYYMSEYLTLTIHLVLTFLKQSLHKVTLWDNVLLHSSVIYLYELRQCKDAKSCITHFFYTQSQILKHFVV